MKIWVLIWFLSISAMNPNVSVDLTKVQNVLAPKTVNQAVVQLNNYFPDWSRNYIENEFDCSEMSAFVYEYLKCYGFEPELKAGYNLSPGAGFGHAWVEIDDNDGDNQIIIECTQLKISNNKNFYKQFTPCSVENISEDEFDFWNSEYIKQIAKFDK